MNDQSLILHEIKQEIDQLRPMLLNDGGDVEIVRFDDGILYIRFLGACTHCPVSQFTLKMGIEDTLVSKIPALKEVVQVD